MIEHTCLQLRQEERSQEKYVFSPKGSRCSYYKTHLFFLLALQIIFGGSCISFNFSVSVSFYM